MATPGPGKRPGMREQLPKQDTLDERKVDDLLDEGYSPAERRPATHDVGTTAAEQREGETFEQRLAQEEPEADAYEQAQRLDGSVDDDGRTPHERSGRLVAPDEGVREDTEKDVVGRDVGIDGGAASAEEAAVHVVPEDEI